MIVDPIQENLENLVDSLRKNRDRTPELADVAAITEVLISTLRHHCRSLDDSIYKEFHYLAAYIAEARSEISQLRPNDLKAEKIPRASAELEAIVQHTEEATGTIMDAAEEIMSADTSDMDAYQGAVTDACMRIFEACSFQDITGQRINKVVRTLTFIEDRLNRLLVVWGANIADADGIAEDDTTHRVDADEAPLSGPALAGEGIGQSEIDNLIGGDSSGPEPDAEAAAPAESTPESADSAAQAAAEEEASTPAEAKVPESTASEAATPDPATPEPATPEPAEADADISSDGDDIDLAAIAGSGEKASQADIDALFD